MKLWVACWCVVVDSSEEVTAGAIGAIVVQRSGVDDAAHTTQCIGGKLAAFVRHSKFWVHCDGQLLANSTTSPQYYSNNFEHERQRQIHETSLQRPLPLPISASTRHAPPTPR